MDNCILRQGLIEALKRANATLQARGIAEARDERTLFPVALQAIVRHCIEIRPAFVRNLFLSHDV
jgi:hypothetical protein